MLTRTGTPPRDNSHSERAGPSTHGQRRILTQRPPNCGNGYRVGACQHQQNRIKVGWVGGELTITLGPKWPPFLSNTNTHMTQLFLESSDGLLNFSSGNQESPPGTLINRNKVPSPSWTSRITQYVITIITSIDNYRPILFQERSIINESRRVATHRGWTEKQKDDAMFSQGHKTECCATE